MSMLYICLILEGKWVSVAILYACPKYPNCCGIFGCSHHHHRFYLVHNTEGSSAPTSSPLCQCSGGEMGQCRRFLQPAQNILVCCWIFGRSQCSALTISSLVPVPAHKCPADARDVSRSTHGRRKSSEEFRDGRSAMAGNVKLRMDCGIHLYPFPSDL